MLDNIRNIGIIAHIDAGKTTTTERILYYSGKIHKIGEIDDGQSTMDFMQQEQERGITIASAAITTDWRGYQINIIDTPGHVDFTAEVERSLRVLDGAVAVICAVGWVQPQTETVWKQADEFKVPRICFVNKMDRIGADFYGAMKDVQEKFKCTTVALEIPIGAGADFDGIIDLLHMKEIHYDAETEGEKFTVSEISESYQAQAKEWHDKMIDTVASSDDALGELYLEGKEISTEQLIAALRRGTINRTFVPFFCGSSRHNQGIQPLMDGIVDFLPAPDEVPAAEGLHLKKDKEEQVEVKCDPASSTPLGLVFKIQYDAQAGNLCFVRMKDGHIQQIGEPLYLYNHPINKFVAGFIGSPPMNFLSVTIKKKGDKLIADEGSFELVPTKEQTEFLKDYIDKEVYFGVRPEDLTFKDAPNSDNNYESGIKSMVKAANISIPDLAVDFIPLS